MDQLTEMQRQLNKTSDQYAELLVELKRQKDLNKQARMYKNTSKPANYGNTSYDTVYIFMRNDIDHPNRGKPFTKEELLASIHLME